MNRFDTTPVKKNRFDTVAVAEKPPVYTPSPIMGQSDFGMSKTTPATISESPYKTLARNTKEGVKGVIAETKQLTEGITPKSFIQALPSGVEGTMEGFANSFVGRPLIREFGAVGNAIVGASNKLFPGSNTQPYAPTSEFEKSLLGTDKAPTFTSVGKEAGVTEKYNLAPIVGAIISIGDVTPWGEAAKGLRGFSTALKETDNIIDTARLMRRAKFSEDLVREYAPIFTKMKDTNEIEKTLLSLENLSKTTTPVPKTDYVSELKALMSSPDPKIADTAKALEVDLSRTHPMDQQSVAKAMVEDLTKPARAVVENAPAPTELGAGYQKIASDIDNMVRSKTLHPEEADMLKVLFENTKDEFLNKITFKANPLIKRSGNVSYYDMAATVKKGIAAFNDNPNISPFWKRADVQPAVVLLHEYGHLADKFILGTEERQVISQVYNQLGKKGRLSLFEQGLSMAKSKEGHGSSYFAKNEKEFLVQSFAEYVMQNKVPSEKMRPILERLAIQFYEGIKKLLVRKSPAMEKLKPVFEKMLSGDKTTPLSQFMSSEPPSYREGVAKMMEAMPPPVKPDIPQSIANNPAAQAPYVDSLQKQILDARDAQKQVEAFNAVPPDPLEYPIQAMEVRDMATAMKLDEIAPKLNDIGSIERKLKDVYRNSEKVFGKAWSIIKQNVFDPFDASKGKMIDDWTKWNKALSENVVDKFGFQAGSKESGAIELWGEGKIKMDELIKQFGEKKAAQIVEADKFFRDAYNAHIDELNAVEQVIYPNSPWKWTPKLTNYYRHGADVETDFSRLQNILDNPVKIDSLLQGKTETTLPKSKWQSFKQRRWGTAERKPDAIGGYLNYTKALGYSVNIDPHIGKFRELADVLRRNTQDTKQLENYISSLEVFANHLSGKTAAIEDRMIQEWVGRRPFQAINWVNERAKGNTVLFSNTASISQILNLPQGIADLGMRNSVKAAQKTLGQIFVESASQAKSAFLKERYYKGFEKFDKGVMNSTKNFGMWALTVLDEVSTKFIWNGEYEKAIQLGVQDPIKYADDITRKLVGGRGVGEKSAAQNSRMMQLVAPFQLEVTNLWWLMEDMLKSDASKMKKMKQFTTLFLAMYMFNNVIEKNTGNRPALDPINAVKDGVSDIIAEPNLSGVTKAGGRLFGEALSNMPFGQTIASVYPEYGTKILPTRKEFFGEEDPTRFGGGILSTKAFADPLFKIAMPFGGNQLKKTLQGISAVSAGKSETAAGEFQYSIAQTLGNFFRGALFGKQGLPETQAFYNKAKTKSGAVKGNRFD